MDEQFTRVTTVKESQTTSTTTTGDQTWAPTGLSLQISLHPRSQEEETNLGKKDFSTLCFPAGCCEFTKHGTFGQHLRRWHSREVFFQTFSCQVQIGMVGGQVSLSCVFLVYLYFLSPQELATDLCAFWRQSKSNFEPLQIKTEEEGRPQQKRCYL